jgi:GNAT superfamily N-acetyltransferase
MNSEKIRIEEIKLKNLDDFARTFFDQSAPGEIIPISRQRVIAHTFNPYAKAEDIVLLAAVRAGKCVGYHGLLPGLLKHDGNLSRIFWATTFYVSEALRGQGIGKLLIERIKALNIDFAVTGMTPVAEKTYLSSGLKTLGPVVFYQLRMEKMYQPIKNFFHRRWLNSQARYFQDFRYQQVDQIRTVLENHSLSSKDSTFFFRDIELINWMLKYPWVVSKAVVDGGKKAYYFANARDIFKYIALEIYSLKNNGLKGFLILSVAHNKDMTKVKILDYHLKDLEDLRILSPLSLEFAAHYSADRIDIPSKLRNCLINMFFQRYFLTRAKRSYVYHPESPTSPLASCADCISLNYCDGDTAFT